MFESVRSKIMQTPYPASIQHAMVDLLAALLKIMGPRSFARIRADSSARKGVMVDTESLKSAERKARREARATEQAWAVALLLDRHRPLNVLKELRSKGLDVSVIEALTKRMSSILKEDGVSLEDWVRRALNTNAGPFEIEFERWIVDLTNSGLSWSDVSLVNSYAREALDAMPYERTSRQSARQLVEMAFLIALVELGYSDLAIQQSEASRTRGIKEARDQILRGKFTPWPEWSPSLSTHFQPNSSSDPSGGY